MKNQLIIIFLFLTSFSFAQKNHVRTEINIPDIPGYLTLKCDFHIHTVFSDGDVWPSHRVLEAWREGLDAIALTDHIEYQPHKHDVNTDLNRPFDISKPFADENELILIKGVEITRSMPPGHMNAIFVEDAEAIRQKEVWDSFKMAKEQNAFVFWNHPGWRMDNEIPVWYDEHTALYDKKYFQGIEVVNEFAFYPKALGWALDKNLTIIGNSDVHSPTDYVYDHHSEKRVITLVFAEEKSSESIKKSLFERKTAVLFENILIGKEEYLEPIFQNSITVVNENLSFKNSNKLLIQIHNSSDIDFELKMEKHPKLSLPESIKLFAGKTIIFRISKPKDEVIVGDYEISFKVENLYTGEFSKLGSKMVLSFVE